MSWQDRIVVDPAILTGKPVIKGTRIAVEFLLDLLAEGWTHEEIVRNYLSLTDEDLDAVSHYAAEILQINPLCRPRPLANFTRSSP